MHDYCTLLLFPFAGVEKIHGTTGLLVPEDFSSSQKVFPQLSCKFPLLNSHPRWTGAYPLYSSKDYTCAQINAKLQLSLYQLDSEEVTMSAHGVQQKRARLSGLEFKTNIICMSEEFLLCEIHSDVRVTTWAYTIVWEGENHKS
jgi:hypothetical protein